MDNLKKTGKPPVVGKKEMDQSTFACQKRKQSLCVFAPLILEISAWPRLLHFWVQTHSPMLPHQHRSNSNIVTLRRYSQRRFWPYAILPYCHANTFVYV